MAKRNQPGCCGCGGGPTCTAPTLSGVVKGCNASNLPDATVKAYDTSTSGTLLGTATTNASGAYTIVATGAISGNSIVVEFSGAPRMDTQTATLTYTAGGPTSAQWSCGATTTLANKTLLPSTNYVCACCPWPIAKTLFMTHSLYGAVTLTWSSARVQWDNTVAYSFPGIAKNACCTGVLNCPASTPSVTLSMSTTCVVNETWTANTNFPIGPVCPGGPASQTGTTISLSSGSCSSTTFSRSGSTTITPGSDPCPWVIMYNLTCGTGTTVNVTVTE